MSKRSGDSGYAAGWCVHYRGIAGPNGDITSCEKGVEYASFRNGVPDGTNIQQPCFLNNRTGESKPGALPCEHLRRPTPEEIAAHDAWAKERQSKTLAALAATLEWAKTSREPSAVIECPVCKGRLHVGVARRNGHTRGLCETDGCVSWIQ